MSRLNGKFALRANKYTPVYQTWNSSRASGANCRETSANDSHETIWKTRRNCESSAISS
jgi:hypothetical protein